MDLLQSGDQLCIAGQRPSPVACLQCRRKHLRCNGTTPVCERCVASGIECSYEKSKRGCKGKKRSLAERANHDSVRWEHHSQELDSQGPMTASSSVNLVDWAPSMANDVSCDVEPTAFSSATLMSELPLMRALRYGFRNSATISYRG